MNYRSPGVYIQEVSMGPKPISAVSTTTTAFVGVAPKANAFVDEPRACNSWTDFVDRFTDDDAQSTALSNAVFGYFANGGGRCYVVNVGKNGSIPGDAKKGSGLHALKSYDDISMIAAPGATTLADYVALTEYAESMGNCFAILDGPAQVDDVAQLTSVTIEGGGTEDPRGCGRLTPTKASPPYTFHGSGCGIRCERHDRRTAIGSHGRNLRSYRHPARGSQSSCKRTHPHRTWRHATDLAGAAGRAQSTRRQLHPFLRGNRNSRLGRSHPCRGS